MVISTGTIFIGIIRIFLKEEVLWRWSETKKYCWNKILWLNSVMKRCLRYI